ncbi:MAG: Ppx/GppA phosphatase family protein [Cyanobacteria bacterium J06631_12]
MKLAAIDIGTNSIHMIVVEVVQQQHFEVIDRVKEMVKLGSGVFATNHLSEQAYTLGLDTLERYVQLADQLGAEEIVTAATSAIREAQNGEAFLREIFRRTKIRPRIISGKEEARLIFLAVRNAIALQGQNALVLDIGGGSTEAVVGNREDIFFATSLKLGVLRLLDMVGDQGPIGAEAQGILESHIRFLAEGAIAQAKQSAFTQVIGTSGTIRTLGEATYLASEKNSRALHSVNAEVVSRQALEALTDQLTQIAPQARQEIPGIGSKRTDAIHLGGILLVQLLKLAGIEQLTLCDASLREGLILDYLKRNRPTVSAFPVPSDLRHRKAAQLVYKYGADWERNQHIAALAHQLFKQTQSSHHLGHLEAEALEYAALLHDIGQYLSLRAYHKSSRYILKREDPRGFTDEEMLLIRQIVRYHRKAPPKTKHKQFRKLSNQQQKTVRILSGILRIVIGLDRTKSQQIESLTCHCSEGTLEIVLSGSGDMAIELWAARSDRQLLETALNQTITFSKATP